MRKLCFVILLFFSLIPIHCYGIQSHLAHYNISLGKINNEAQIIDISGKSIYLLEKKCLGWKINEDFAIVFEFENGSNSQLVSSWSTFETFSGEAFEFELKEIVNDEEEKFFGYANLISNGGFASYISDTETKINLSNNVKFPMQHLIKLIQSAKENKKIFNSKIFIGSEKGQGYRLVTAILGEKKIEKTSLFLDNLNLDTYWSVSLAYFDPFSLTGKPEYEMHANIHEEGIITKFEIDYGIFSLNADLIKIEPVPLNSCE